MLTDRQCRTAKAGVKPVKLFDAHGLHLHVRPTGTKSWRLKYRIAGREKQVVFGSYPDMRLADARALTAKARKVLSEGRDPSPEFGVKALRHWSQPDPERTFEAVALRWYDLQALHWKERHARKVLESLEANIFPKLGQTDIKNVKAEDIRTQLAKVQKRGSLETAHRILQRLSSIFAYASSQELVDKDPTANIAPSLAKFTTRRQPAILQIERARAFLTAFESGPSIATTKLASRLMALTAARTGMIQFAERAEFEDLDGSAPIWRVPAAKMKLRLSESEEEALDFMLPLSRQSVEVVKAALALAGKRKYLFPGRQTGRAMTENALSVAYRRVVGWDGQQVPHGWRSSFSTIMNERAMDAEKAGDRAVIDLMLAHVPQGVEGKYNRAAYMPRRRQIAQEWADLLSVGLVNADTLAALPTD
jgi:integrase